MERREFLTSTLATSAFALAGSASAQPASGRPREYYEIRKYHLQTGPQTKLTDTYLSEALIPALNRLGIAPVGAFHLDNAVEPCWAGRNAAGPGSPWWLQRAP